MKFPIYLLLLLSFITSISFAQQNSTTSKNTPNKKMQLFFEKIYLHTDRNLYSSGDDIWFKAYLVNAISNIPMETSKILYVELISGDTKYYNQIKINLTNGLGFGDFKLPDSIPTGTYTIRAYTNWMLNFGDIFHFKKEIKIVSALGIASNVAIINNRKPVINFYPEGGSALIESINNIAFKAIDENGKGCEAKGIIINSNNDTLCWFNTSSKGMGTFAYMPILGEKYYAVGNFQNNLPFKSELPEPLLKGYGMRISDFDTSTFFISIYTNQYTLDEHPNEVMIINALSHYKNAFTGQVAINNLKTDIRISKKAFPKGITCITLYDTLLHAHCQRLFNVTKNNQLQVSIQPDKQTYKPREKISVNIKITNKQGQPIKTNLSFSATDNNQVPPDITNIASYLMLESEIKGKVEDPWLYFDVNNPSRNKQLDLLLLTQGWRDYIWRRVKDTTINIKHMVELGFSISGRVRQKFADNPLPNMNVSAYIPGMSGSLLKKTFSTTTNEKGIFYIDGIESFGLQNARVTSRDVNGKYAGWILLDSVFKPKVSAPKILTESDTAYRINNYAKESIIRKKTLRKYTLSDTIELDEVVVSATKSKADKQLNMHISEAGYPDHIYVFDDNDRNFTDLGAFMMQKIPGARFPDTTNPGDPFNRVLFNVMGTNEPPRFNVDGRKYRKGDIDDENYVYNIQLSDIEKIMVSTTDIESGGKGYVISIFTSPNSGAKKEFYTANTKFEGFYEARTFYSPVYPENYEPIGKPDLRPTLFWNPTLETNENGECSTNFYNSDKRTTVRISAEGITEDGTPVVITGSYEVK